MEPAAAGRQWSRSSSLTGMNTCTGYLCRGWLRNGSGISIAGRVPERPKWRIDKINSERGPCKLVEVLKVTR
jgi:hypothetical protein